MVGARALSDYFVCFWDPFSSDGVVFFSCDVRVCA